MRLFVGIRPSEAFRSALALLEDRLRAAGVTGRYLDASNLHMTLAFIGEWPEDPEDVTAVLPEVPHGRLRYSMRYPKRLWQAVT